MKRFAIVAIFLTLLFVGNAHAENQSTTEYKIEQIKEDIKKLETDLTKLEDDVDDSKDDKLENKKDLESLDNRGGDINGSVDRFGYLLGAFGLLLTALLVGFGFLTYRDAKKEAEEVAKKEAEDTTKDWIEKEGKSKLEPIIKELRESFEKLAKDKEMEINQLFEKFKQDHQNQLDEQKNDYKQFKETYTNEEKADIDKNAIESQNKDVKTFDDYWNIMTLHYLNKNFEAILEVVNQAESLLNLTDSQKSDLLFAKVTAYNNMGVICTNLKNYDKAIEAYQKTIEMNPKDDEAYLNLFELELMRNQDFSLEEPFFQHLGENKEAMMNYQMLKILQMIATNKPYALTAESWSEKYRDIKIDWDWEELHIWTSNVKDSDIKTKLSEALEVFKNHNKSCEYGVIYK